MDSAVGVGILLGDSWGGARSTAVPQVGVIGGRAVASLPSLPPSVASPPGSGAFNAAPGGAAPPGNNPWSPFGGAGGSGNGAADGNEGEGASKAWSIW